MRRILVDWNVDHNNIWHIHRVFELESEYYSSEDFEGDAYVFIDDRALEAFHNTRRLKAGQQIIVGHYRLTLLERQPHVRGWVAIEDKTFAWVWLWRHRLQTFWRETRYRLIAAWHMLKDGRY